MPFQLLMKSLFLSSVYVKPEDRCELTKQKDVEQKLSLIATVPLLAVIPPNPVFLDLPSTSVTLATCCDLTNSNKRIDDINSDLSRT